MPPDGLAERHYTFDDLTALFLGDQPEAEMTALETHLVECHRCAERALKAFRLSSDSAQWTARAHGQAYLRERLREALVQAVDAPEIRGLQQWVQKQAGRAAGIARVIQSAPGRAVRFVTEGLDFLLMDGAPYAALAPVRRTLGGPIRTRGGPPRLPGGGVLVLAGPGGSTAEMRLGGGELVVRFRRLPPGTTPPVVLLIPTEPGTPTRTQNPERTPAEDAWTARFQDLPGDFLVALGPTPAQRS
jgi:hypothetical protein